MKNEEIINRNDVLEYIKGNLECFKSGVRKIDAARYHHNTSYKDAVSVCKHGILTIDDLKKQGIRNYSDETLKRLFDTDSHANGDKAVSLAVVGLEDLYKDEMEFDPCRPYNVDFIISNDVKAGRSSINYGNEFLVYESIKNNKIRSVDVRLLKLITLFENGENNVSMESIIKKYNTLKAIALTIKELELNVPIREMSQEDYSCLDLDDLSKFPTLVLK